MLRCCAETKAPPGEAMQRSAGAELRTAVLLAMCFGVVMLDRMAQLFLGPYLVKDLGLRPSQIGLLAGVVAVCWAASTFVFGMVSDRVGRKRVLIPAMILFSLLSWVSGLARSFQELLIVRALLGLAEGPCWSVIMALMEESSTPARRGRNIGVVVCAGALVGSAIGPVFATQVAAAFGWRGAFFAAGIPGLILAAVVALLIPEPPRAGAGERLQPGAFGALMRQRDMWLCFVAALLLTVWVFGFNAFAPLYITQVRRLPATTAGLILGASGFGGFVYCLVWPGLSDRTGRRPAIIAAAIIAIVLPLIFLAPAAANARLLAAVAFMTTSGTAVAALVMIVTPVELAPKSLAATAIGFVSIGGEALGATLGPIAGGLLSERYGLGAPLIMAGAAAALIAVIGLALRETHPRSDAATLERRPG
jgi:predicted MFS family arabinose efflux permease